MTRDPAVLKKFDASYLEPMNLSVDEFTALVRDDFVKWKAIVETAGVKLE